MKVSIIVPVYNVEKYLDDCIESVINQSYKNIEIILVDDGSKDNSGIICDNYAKKDHRIIVFHQKNSGVSSARNKGISVSKGEYITFIDSDDYVDKDYIKKLVENIGEKRETVCKTMMFNGDEKTTKCKIGKEFVLDKNSFIELSKTYLLCTPCCKLFNCKIIRDNKIEFDTSISIGEDLLFNLQYLNYIDEVIILDQCLYYYRRSNNNTLSTAYNPLFKKICIRLIDEYAAFFKNLISKEEDLEHFDTWQLFMIVDVIQNEFRNRNASIFRRIHNAREVLKDKNFKNKINSFKHTKEKLYCFLLSHNMCLTYKIVDKFRSIIRGKCQSA